MRTIFNAFVATIAIAGASINFTSSANAQAVPAGQMPETLEELLHSGTHGYQSSEERARRKRRERRRARRKEREREARAEERRKKRRERRRSRKKESEKKPEFYRYKPARLVTVRDKKLTEEVFEQLSDSPYSRWIQDVLTEGTQPSIRAERSIRDAVIKFYMERNFAPVWIDAIGLSRRGERLVHALSGAAEHGLMVSRYLPPVLDAPDTVPGGIFQDPERVAALDIGLSVMAVKFAKHASGGQVKPRLIGRSYDITPPAVKPADALRQLANTEFPDKYLDSLHPVHPLYLQLKARLSGKVPAPERTTPVVQIPSGPTIYRGEDDRRIPLIRARLIKLGYLRTRHSSSTYFDKEMSRAVKKYQSAKGLNRDGIIGRRTVAALNGKSRNKRRYKKIDKSKIALNMERLRWFPRSLGTKHVIVNQAAFQAQVVEHGRKIHQMRVIVGKPKHPTPIFKDEMETVVFNPYWNVPRSIIGNEMMPKLRRNASYLDRKGFEVIDRRGKRVRSSRVRWSKYTGKTLPYNVRQKPGSRNALGEVKFLFPNKHAVYMHDTPSRHLFRNSHRAYSHGCVRVQNPKKFAEIVLGWNSRKVSGAVKAKKNKPVRLQKKLPVYMTYFTLWPDDSGRLAQHKDFYKRDEALTRALRATQASLTRKGNRNLSWLQSSLEQ